MATARFADSGLRALPSAARLHGGRVAGDQRTLCVAFDSEEAFRREYESNLSNGGVFVPGEENFELRETVRVELQLSYANRAIGLEAEVVHIVPPEMAQLGGRPGVAVQFKGIVADVRATLEQLAGQELPPPPAPAPPRPEAEKRTAARSTARVAARIEDGDAVVDGRTRNLSKTGVLVGVSGATPPVGENVQLTLRHPTTGEEKGVQGKVVRHVRAGEEVEAVAIQFDPEASEREEVEEFVSQVQSAEYARRLGGITGAIEELGPQNLLQMFAATAPKGTLHLRNDREEATIGFEGGLMRYCYLGASTGMDALVRILSWKDGTFEFHAHLEEMKVSDPPLPLEAALLEAACQIDESEVEITSRFALQAHFVVNDGADRCGGQLTKVEAAVLDLARGGSSVQRMLDIIPEPDPDILRALESLADDELIEVVD
jgi:Tfp pilus assembly protein PilZ